MLYNIIVAPIEYIVGWIFMFIINKISSIGVIGAICGVSVCVNILALPLYNIAESIQEKERQINKKMEPRVKRIKKGFKGDEQFMILSEYYRQNNYHPLYALRGSLSILIEIPFFIAAYNYLSASEILKEASFWIFSNLGEADRMFSITLGSLIIPINILPILMTVINFVSGYIYTKNATTRDKIQLYALGLVFLVLLYNSPSGLVIYWILNNIFSLVKTIVLKTKHPGRFLHAFLSLGLIAFAWKFRHADERANFYLVVIVTVIFITAPFIAATWKKIRWRINLPDMQKKGKRNYLPVTLISGLALAFLCGFLLPSSTIATSPEEFSYLGSIPDPSSYIWSSLWFFTGLFVFWPLVIYKMFGEKVKKWEALILFVLLITALSNAYIFTSNYGSMNTTFVIEDENDLLIVSSFNKAGEIITPLLAVTVFILFDCLGKTAVPALISLVIAISEVTLSTVKLVEIEKRFSALEKTMDENSSSSSNEEFETVYHLSKGGKNVVVLFIDRAFSQFLPYVLDQYPELKGQLDGFVYYPNTLSFGGNTTFAYPAMVAGYEYTPDKMNEMEGTLRENHNEALTVAPLLFKDAGYSVTVTDPALPNYNWRNDFTPFENLDGVNVEYLYAKYTDRFLSDNSGESHIDMSATTKKEIRNFSVLQIFSPSFRMIFNVACRGTRDLNYFVFVDSFAPLYYINSLTDFTADTDTYTFIGNEASHTATYLDSTLSPNSGKYSYAEVGYPTNDETTKKHYLPFTAVMKTIGNWLDYLRENNAYDNTRIIIVSDHGYALDNNLLSSSQTQFNPILLYKDFDAEGELSTDYTFMTNADTIFLSKEGLEEVSDTNSVTGNTFTQKKENGVNVYQVVVQKEWNAPSIRDLERFTLEKNQAYHVIDNIFDSSNWITLSQWEEMTK